MNDWGTALAELGAVMTAGAAGVAAWNAWGKQRSDSSKLTLDGVFQLVNELQEEIARKNVDLDAMAARCRARIKELEVRQRDDRQTLGHMQAELETLRMGRSRPC